MSEKKKSELIAQIWFQHSYIFVFILIFVSFLDTFIITNKRQIKKSIMQLPYIHTDNECDAFHRARIQNKFA